ncbi:MAG: DUF853 domain-containing protein [Paludibacteraceae bacterium]|nr:DUF853 domain-containing protein [Paludibacteraceae bacterium]
MLDRNDNLYVAHSDKPLYICSKMANRHGVISGATGTGKTVSLQVLAESFSELGVPVFMADMKGDLSGVYKAGSLSKFIEKRQDEFHVRFDFQPYPARFFDVYGEQGHPLRATISDMGPLLMSRLLELNETQTGVLTAVFRIADDNGLLLIDLKDLRAMLHFVGEHSSEYTVKYGNISSASIGAIQRGLLRLEEEGGEKFFAEPAFNVMDFLQREAGKGVINILAADKLFNAPKLYGAFLLWLLSSLYNQLPEVGDQPKPKFVFFFDEAHLLFKDASKVLLEKIEQIVRLIRSKGVGVYFITQNPMDIPESILGQLGNRIQHALRAYTPKDKQAIHAIAQTFRENKDFNTEQAILELETGEALISFLDEKGAPSVVERAKMLCPQGQIGPLTSDERARAIERSPLYGTYEKSFDRESAYEILQEQNLQEQKRKEAEKQAELEEKERVAREKEIAKARKEAEKTTKSSTKTTTTSSRSKKSTLESSTDKFLGTLLTTIGRNLGNQLVRSVLGTLLKK